MMIKNERPKRMGIAPTRNCHSMFGLSVKQEVGTYTHMYVQFHTAFL